MPVHTQTVSTNKNEDSGAGWDRQARNACCSTRESKNQIWICTSSPKYTLWLLVWCLCGTTTVGVVCLWIFNLLLGLFLLLGCLVYPITIEGLLPCLIASHFVLFGCGLLEVCSIQNTKWEWSGVDLVERKDEQCRGVEKNLFSLRERGDHQGSFCLDIKEKKLQRNVLLNLTTKMKLCENNKPTTLFFLNTCCKYFSGCDFFTLNVGILIR